MKEAKDEKRREFVSKVASVSIATALGGLAGLAGGEAQARTPARRATRTLAMAQRQEHSFQVVSRGKPPDAGKPDASALEDGDLAKIAKALDEHPDAAVRAVLKQTAEGLATKDAAREQFGRDVRGALKTLNIDMPEGLLPNQLQVPNSIRDAAAKRKGWGIGSGHSNRNYTATHRNHRNYSDYSDWW